MRAGLKGTELNMLSTVIKDLKFYFCHYLHTHMLSQTCINFFLVLNTKEDILKNVDSQTVAGPH